MSGTAPLPLIPTNGTEVSIEQARLAGRQLAEHPLLAARHDGEHPGVAEVLTDARPLLSTYGVNFEVVRTRPGLVVLRARSDGRVSAQVACELVKALLGAVPDQVCDVKAQLVENTCAQRGASACLFSMMWEERAPSAPLPPPPPETLLDQPLGAAEPPWASAPPVAAAAAEPSTIDAPAPPDTPPSRPDFETVADARLVDWDRPIPPEPPDVAPLPAAPVAEQVVKPTPSQTTTSRPTPEPTPVSTAASSTAYQFQVSVPSSIVVPPARRPETAPPAPSPPGPPTGRPRRNLLRGITRRAWLLALAVVAGTAGGWFAGVHAGTSYGAQATLAVQSGAGKSGPGAANDALALATTYAALIPKDQAILNAAAGSLNMSPTAVGKAVSVTVETGTSILLLNFTASTPAQALQGANAVARAVASTKALTPAIAPGSVAIVSLPTSAHRQGTLHKYGIVLGAFLGLVVGLILVLAAERADPRIDDAPSLAAASGCRAALVPAELSFPELARVLSDAGRETGPLTVVPIAVADTAPTMELARGLRPCWPPNGPAVAISPAFSSGVVELSRGSGPTVLVSHPGARQRDVLAAAERLRMIGRPPLWAVLANRRLRSRVSGRVG